ncbi:3-hydroxybutyryl-CoA dehydrogenase [Umezawaea tangerina]|uniref:3-hydroxybutyryl-CoA dehydrogenase n=1 Tax=Umezawaea tangerina TaxID=84725 RepID=A0A2T0T7M9_9PSEU|nr:3-hydroxybutyryl-CoA dehydrogenase [Umezawaea tangerina]PRY41689.1 3-hydroxybutyryl-CoA dehydrogenase [Umezawaea tangerina]
MRLAVNSVGVVGAGLMGSGIAEVCARAGMNVLVGELTSEAAASGRARIETSFDRAMRKGKLERHDRDDALGRLSYTVDLDEFADRELVIEAIAEDEQLKVDLFSRLDKVLTWPDVVLATNTSSVPIMRLAMATSRPGRVIGMHFFNPVPVLSLVELIPSLLTEPATVERARTFAAETLGKVVVNAQDRTGFVVNALLIPYLLSAIRMLESGAACVQDIDLSMVLGCAHPMGPLRLADLIGLDTMKSIADSMYREFKEQRYAPPPLLLRMVDAGLYGRKSGRGFYDYSAS